MLSFLVLLLLGPDVFFHATAKVMRAFSPHALHTGVPRQPEH